MTDEEYLRLMGELPMTEQASPGMVPVDSGNAPAEAQKMTREDWEREVAREREAQDSGSSADESEDDFQRRFDAAMAEERAKHTEELQSALARVPQLAVPAHSGGPGNDNHQVSWSLADQEAAMRGETLDHWTK